MTWPAKLAPLMIRRFGIVNGIVWMMMATAAGLGAMGSQPPAYLAVLAYSAYMAFQWMSEPGLNTLVMNHVKEEERSGASSITYLVAFSAQAVAAMAASRLRARRDRSTRRICSRRPWTRRWK